MSKKYFVLSALAVTIVPALAFAQGAGASSDPSWFPLMEVAGVIIAIYTVISMSQATGASTGGGLHKVFMLFVWGSIAFAAALLWRAYGEVTGQEAAFVLSFVFEALLYVGLICLAVGGQKAKKVLTVGK